MLRILTTVLSGLVPQDPPQYLAVASSNMLRSHVRTEGRVPEQTSSPASPGSRSPVDEPDPTEPARVRHRPATDQAAYFAEVRGREAARGFTGELDRWSDAVAIQRETASQWSPWLRSTLGLRSDSTLAGVDGDASANHDVDGTLRAEAGFAARPSSSVEWYGSFAAAWQVDDAPGEVGDDPTEPRPARAAVAPLMSTRATEVGLRWGADEARTSVSLWGLAVDDEVVFADDADETETSRASRRWGIAATHRWWPQPWLCCDGGVGLARAWFVDDDPVGDDVPETVPMTVTTGMTAWWTEALSTSLRVCHLGGQPWLGGDGRPAAATVVDVGLQWRLSAASEFSFDVSNLLGTREDVEYFHAVQPAGEAAGGDGHVHAIEPTTLRLSYTIRF